ncbi:Beta-hexosaminidase subunit alpha [Chionoecetes opilio]|uniref:Beta-hexosaminidase n=1 Tax=Chionoecetes opilio TaxID=41210 RepID=A0A8J5C1L1_CHIOP|nr:Beta-hexosaminidase subunit alpha [Chionoecetes opilio]
MHPALLVTVVGLIGVVLGGTPLVNPTVGKVWPCPQAEAPEDTYMIIRPHTFFFNVTRNTCAIVDEALLRYKKIMFPSLAAKKSKYPWRKDDNFRGYLDNLQVVLLTKCEERPYQGMDEQYEIKINSPDAPGEGFLLAQSVWGILRGLETFSQLLVPNAAVYNVNSTQIRDFPRFSYRGLMLDTSRHYLPVSKIKETLDLMAMNKLNAFHWHIVDDQSFPYVSSAYPGLSEQGAYSPSHVYTEGDIASIVTYGNKRGIRVLPEFDTPGRDGEPDGTYGPIDPTNDANYNFLKTLFEEVTTRFPDHYLHLGGDEVSFDCWKSNPNITTFMSQLNITGDYSKLEELYISKLIEIVGNLPTKNGYLVWQEVFDNGVNIADDTVVHIWKNGNTPLIFKEELKKVTAAGYNTILSSCWYLNYISYGVDWHKYYQCDPHDFKGTEAQKRLVIGGEACMWGEYVDRTNLISRTWPRASVVAEKLWSNATITLSTDQATPRLEEHRCRLLGRGYDVEPLWQSFCAADVIDDEEIQNSLEL